MYLQRADLDFENRTVRVKAKPEYGFVPKRWHERTISLEEGLAVASEARCKRLKRSDLVFPIRNGKANSKHRIALTRVAKNAGMDDSRPRLHKFRATAATNWLGGGIDLGTVQMLLGRRSLESALRYLKPMAGSNLHQGDERPLCGAIAV